MLALVFMWLWESVRIGSWSRVFDWHAAGESILCRLKTILKLMLLRLRKLPLANLKGITAERSEELSSVLEDAAYIKYSHKLTPLLDPDLFLNHRCLWTRS